MNSPTIAKATLVDRAMERLEAAVQRLEHAMGSSSGNSGDSAPSMQVSELVSEVERLKALNTDTVARIDQTIDRLERLSNAAGDD